VASKDKSVTTVLTKEVRYLEAAQPARDEARLKLAEPADQPVCGSTNKAREITLQEGRGKTC
jgi:hypothetical protein